MARQENTPTVPVRDGTSQGDRHQAALDPDYARVDERSLRDFLAFSRAYAGELNYFNEENQVDGDWSRFVGNGLDLDAAAAYAVDPSQVASDKAEVFARPHFALLLSYLRLVRHAQDGLNTITRRHLEFYYEQILGMTRKATVPDRVNVLLRPSPRTAEVEVPAGSLLAAGKDSLGRERFYRTEKRLLVNRAEVARLSTVHAERTVMGIREARESGVGSHQDRVELMLRIALGRPQPGDPLPDYPKGEKIDYAALKRFAAITGFAWVQLFMELFELRELMKLKQRRDNDARDWRLINSRLELAGKARTGDQSFRLEPVDPRDFDANPKTALGGAPDFAGLPQVEDIDDLYDQRTRRDVQDFIRDKLHFQNLRDFLSMVQVKRAIDTQWKEINRIIELAGGRKRNSAEYRLPDSADPTGFDTNLRTAIGPIAFDQVGVSTLDEYHAWLVALEDHFFMSAENFAYIMEIAEKSEREATTWEWSRVDGILADAHREKVLAGRRLALRLAFAGRVKGGSTPREAFDATVRIALGESPERGPADPLDRLRDYVADEKEFLDLERFRDRLERRAARVVDANRVFRILERAQRVRERFPDPVAQIENWVNLHAHVDATSVTVGDDANNPRWQTFGGVVPESGTEDQPAENMGWAVASPMLALSAGARRIHLTLGFRHDEFDATRIASLFQAGVVAINDYEGPFPIEISTKKGWGRPNSIEAKLGNYRSLSGVDRDFDPPLEGLQLILQFSEQVDPIAVPSEGEMLAGSPWPVLRLMMRQIQDKTTGRYTTAYVPFEELRLETLHIRVDVGDPKQTGGAGLVDFDIQNDQTVLSPKKPFEPFGSSPTVGTRFSIGHPELSIKRLDYLRLRVEWMGAPSSFSTHYQHYKPAVAGWRFKTQVRMVDKRGGFDIGDLKPLFAARDATAAHEIAFKDVTAALRRENPDYQYRRSLEPNEGQNVLDWSRYFQWELTPLYFQHQAYPAIAAQVAAQLAKALATDPPDDVTPYSVNPPFTPTIKKLCVEYGASLEIDLDSDRRGEGRADRIYHIHPFGLNPVHRGSGGCRFLPDYGQEGELYLGILNADPPQTLSVLFQMAEGRANPNLEPVPVQWSYLSGDRWLSLADGGIRHDGTRGLINSGIVEFDLKPAEASTRMPAGYYWIRAAIPRNSDSVCDTVAIHAQAVAATFADRGNASDHYAQPLPGNTITQLSPRIPGIAEVAQPYTSFGGKPQEREETFYTRVSERIRHKQRALTIWDYERLVLEQYPQIYKAKCLPADAKANPDGAGALKVIVIPDVRDRLPFDPFQPKAPADLLTDINEYLTDLAPPFAGISVANAHFVQVKVRVRVRFKEGYDEGFYSRRLNDDLNRFLSPWAYQEGAGIAIGGRIYANSIVNFIDGREYVDYLRDIKLFSSHDDGRTFNEARPTQDEGLFVTTDHADGVLVAAPQHVFDVIVEGAQEEEVLKGINYMKIELDFVVEADDGSDGRD